MDENKNERIPYDPDINHIVDTTIWKEEPYRFEEDEKDNKELLSSLAALGIGIGTAAEEVDQIFQTIDNFLSGVEDVLDDLFA